MHKRPGAHTHTHTDVRAARCFSEATPLSLLIRKLNSTRNAIMELQGCEGTGGPRKTELGRKREDWCYYWSTTDHRASARETSWWPRFPCATSCWVIPGWRSNRPPLPGGTWILPRLFLPLSLSTSPTTLPSSHWKGSGKYLASDTISSLQ